MEDVLSNLDSQEIISLITSTLIQRSPKLNSIRQKLEGDRYNLLDDQLKQKFESCLSEAKKIVSSLESNIDAQIKKNKPIRLYMDGVFDIIHSGHFNAFRQAKKLGDTLVCGVNSDEDVAKVKGPTLMDITERGALAGASKWIDEVEIDTPYTPTCATLDSYGCQYITHGDDIPFNEFGVSCYDEMFKTKRIRIFPRTEGISTTVIIGRLLLSLKDKFEKLDLNEPKNIEILGGFKEIENLKNLQRESMTTLLTTSWRISEFSNKRVPNEGDRIVYITGDFDILHKGHIEALKKAKEFGDFVYVGVYDDFTCNKIFGKNYPILNINERALNLLALRYVDEVIFGAPEKINEDMIKHLNIQTVVEFITPKMKKEGKTEREVDTFSVPQKLGICKEVEVSMELTNEILAERIWADKERYIKKYISKTKKGNVTMTEAGDGNGNKEEKKQQP